ncbi:MAG: hypothetical protein J0I47_08790 [Sphingomonas sp.]|uniref:hypothetical protein n=1 Tax=Sphingomonas sp. TaxID=28214 RepID=UPI001AC2BCFC|nr:hypothetical protein [Sphingomonas sp.]MBN8808317.1 hypothetical protein [Sphingomonas sp.]
MRDAASFPESCGGAADIGAVLDLSNRRRQVDARFATKKSSIDSAAESPEKPSIIAAIAPSG